MATLVAPALLIAACGASMAKKIGVDGRLVRVGFIGQARRSPLMPVSRPGTENSAPMAGATIRVLRLNGEIVGDVVSDSSGFFAAWLAPGTYTLRPLELSSNSPYPATPAPQDVVVPDNGVARVTFIYDTGIR